MSAEPAERANSDEKAMSEPEEFPTRDCMDADDVASRPTAGCIDSGGAVTESSNRAEAASADLSATARADDASAAARPADASAAAEATVYVYDEAQIAAVCEALAAAKRTIRSSTPSPVPGAEGWKMRWVWRRGSQKSGDPYWLTPSGDEVRSGPEAVRWMESGGRCASTKKNCAPPRRQPSAGGRDAADPPAERRQRREGGASERPRDPCLVDAGLVMRPLSARSSLLLTPLLAGDAERLRSVLERDAGHAGAATVQPGMLQKAASYRGGAAAATAHRDAEEGAQRSAALLAVLLAHLPADPIARSAVIDHVDPSSGHTALSIACLGMCLDDTLMAHRMRVP